MQKIGTLFIILSFSVVAACGSGSSSSGGEQDISWNEQDTTTPDTSTPDTTQEETYVPQGTGELTFVDQFGDDAKTCVAATVCAKTVTYNSERSLDVRYAENGSPKEGVPLRFEVIEDPDGAGKMSVATVYSNTEGVATGTVKAIKAITTSFKVKVSLPGSDVAPLFFTINVVPKIQAFLTVSFNYAGTRSFDGVTVYLFKSASADAADLPCAEIDPLDLPTIDLQQGPVLLSQTVKFQDLPGLADEGTQFYTVCARGEMADGAALTYGCNDVDGQVMSTSAKHVAITLDDIPPNVAGEYDVVTELDLVSALPDNVEGTVNTVLDFFEKPSASLLLLICKIENATLNDLCGYVFNDELNPSVYDLTMIGAIILDIVDAFLAAYVEDWTGQDIIGLGEDVRDMLKELKLLSTYAFAVEPGGDNALTVDETSAEWHTVEFRWTYGQNCPAGDDACGVMNFSFQAIGQQAVVSHFPASFEPQADFTDLRVGSHSLELKYGALVNHILQKFVLPQVFGDGSDGLPVIDTYEKLLKSFLGGGKECLEQSASQPSCCNVFVTNVLNQTGGISEDVLSQSCETLVLMGSKYLEDQLLGLDLDTGNNLLLKTPDDQPCRMFDNNNDMKIDAWGKKEPKTDRCVWEIYLNVLGADTLVGNNFYAGEHQ